ncbi:uncharacterized protein [Rutidosis leptorrhynchoides]|uniref:uncharacterized protein n=1 Tax=Rutidosis leptorrhynchoides TaxID=125765 RepID=UPI003A9A5B78
MTGGAQTNDNNTISNITLSAKQFQILLAAAQGNHSNGNNGQQNLPKTCSYKDFSNCKPPSYKGTEGPVELTRWFEKLESIFWMCNCTDVDRVKFATGSLSGGALTWWTAYSQTVGLDAANAIPWTVLKRMMTDKYCPRNQVQKMESEFWELKVKGTDIEAYTNRFLELATLCPDMVPTEHKKIECYVEGLPDEIQGNVIAAGKETVNGVILMAQNLVMAKRRKLATNKQTEVKDADNKRKFEPAQSSGQGSNKRVSDATKSGYIGTKPLCNRCDKHHHGRCTVECSRCKKIGHLAKNCKVVLPATNTPAAKTNPTVPTCYGCGEVGHFRNQCPKNKTATAGNAKGRAFFMTTEEAREEDEVITADKNFKIDLLPVELGSFDVVVGMDWLTPLRAAIMCYDKAINIPLENGETLIIQGEKSGSKLNIISCIKTRRYLMKGYQATLSNVKEVESEEKRIEDVPVVREFPEVFPEELPGLPPQRQVKFQIDLTPSAAPIAKEPYRLAPSEMKELSIQLQELLEKGFICPSSSPWGAPTNLTTRIREAQLEALKEESVQLERLKGLENQLELKGN